MKTYAVGQYIEARQSAGVVEITIGDDVHGDVTTVALTPSAARNFCNLLQYETVGAELFAEEHEPTQTVFLFVGDE